MSQLNLSDLIVGSVPLSLEEAVALTLGVADAMGRQGLTVLPADQHIILSSTGRVTLEGVGGPDADGEAAGVLAAQLAALMRRLLQLDRTAPVNRPRVPVPVLDALARATEQAEQTDRPAISTDEFRRSLEPFGAPEPTVLAGLFWRAARLCAPSRAPAVTLPAVKVESALVPRGAGDRRQNLPPPSELRRYLRETERELFEARARPERSRAPQAGQSRGASPTPATAAQARRPFYVTRLWRVSSGIAATVVGAVLGTFMAFLLAGSVHRSPESVVSSAPGVPAIEADGAGRRERTVQPLVLAGSVGADVFSPSFGPRGRALLFHTGRKAAPLMRASVSDAGDVELDRIETLLDDGAANFHVTMSPDETWIAYDSDRDGVRGVYVARVDGRNPRRISGPGYAAVPSWSPDGERIAFVRAEPGRSSVWNVWFAGIRSGQLQRVTSHSRGQPWGASWFPDGQRLAYNLEDRIMVADLRSGLARGYRSPRDGRPVRTPAVSPDGRWIVFQVQQDGVWLLDLTRARMRRILADETAEEFVWSPDGSAIAYQARKAGSYGLWRLALRP